MLIEFPDRDGLVCGMAEFLVFNHFMATDDALSLADKMAVCDPDVYSGGWVIPTFGFSTENGKTGDPFLVPFDPDRCD